MHINIYENNDENTIQQRKRIYIVCVDWARKASTHLISHRVSTRLALSSQHYSGFSQQTWLRLHQLANEITHLNEENHNTSFQPPSQSNLLLFVLDDIYPSCFSPTNCWLCWQPLTGPYLVLPHDIGYKLKTSHTIGQSADRIAEETGVLG